MVGYAASWVLRVWRGLVRLDGVSWYVGVVDICESVFVNTGEW